jgi:hypothetical protein
MNIDFSLSYDVVFKDLNGKERGLDGVKFLAPVSLGDCILWHSCELKVDFITHFIDGQRPTINASVV